MVLVQRRLGGSDGFHFDLQCSSSLFFSISLSKYTSGIILCSLGKVSVCGPFIDLTLGLQFIGFGCGIVEL
jgi:hypothetical protein